MTKYIYIAVVLLLISCNLNPDKMNWKVILEELAHLVNPLLSSIFKKEKHYWVFAQFEYSTDLIFSDTSYFKEIKEQVFKACNVMSVDNIFSFFGRKMHGNYRGDTGGSYKKRYVSG